MAALRLGFQLAVWGVKSPLGLAAWAVLLADYMTGLGNLVVVIVDSHGVAVVVV